MKSKIQLITPEIAAIYLEQNTQNRRARSIAVKHLAAAMLRGEWVLTAQGISFDTDGRLIDGQHRLMAVIESKMVIEMMVFTEVDPEAFKVMDRGTTRTLSDVTRLSPRHVDVLSFFHDVCGNKMKPTAEQLFALNAIFGSSIDAVLHKAPTNRKGFTQVGARAAVVLLTHEGCNSAVDIYRRLTLADFSGVSPIVNTLVKQIVTDRFVRINGGGGAQSESFCKALFALDPKNADRVQLVFSEDMRKNSFSRVKKAVGQ